ncbi:DUF982 domain-containing protein [Rhizobium grahamii]|uniref:DUF982 domain-containing protein n=2 Tax=Rhizobium grahamii TaxID=1120045 RepID=S3HSK5_9HYPH|nr:DUF982 domain-containing protein [Rhizobium grahamii]EPE96196.1 hypothetical protein RGCCGE502_21500 [Rhizobium grahamii CCGE 502]RDJ03009.1 hypothetical protein B5K06_31495 [Rhizobium grahamii]
MIIAVPSVVGSEDGSSVSGWLIVLVKRKQSVYTVTSAKDAVDLLFSDWPAHDGTPFIEAMEACEGVGKGTVTNEEAQFAFLAAAMDANVPFEFL